MLSVSDPLLVQITVENQIECNDPWTNSEQAGQMRMEEMNDEKEEEPEEESAMQWRGEVSILLKGKASQVTSGVVLGNISPKVTLDHNFHFAPSIQ